MKTKLTFRYIGMVILSTGILFVFSFFVLTHIENSMQSSEDFRGDHFAYNFAENIEVDSNENILFSERGKEKLIEQNSWVQILNREGYVIDAFNTPSYAANQYSPVEIVHMNLFRSNHEKFTYYTGKIDEDLNFLMAVPIGTWKRTVIEFDDQMVIQFIQMMFVIALLVFLIMGYIFSRRIAKPVAQIVEGVEALAEGNYKVKYKEKGLYRTVFTSLNHLVGRLTSNEIEQTKTKALREEWISNISHDLKTPLSSIKGYSEILADAEYEFSAEEIKQYSTTIHEKSIYMENLIEELRLNERLMHNSIMLNKEDGNLSAFVREMTIDILNHPDYKHRKIKFKTTHENIPYSFDRELFQRSFENLIYNALIHNDEDTEVVVLLELKMDNIVIEISDNGQGMNSEQLSQLFNRYYRGSNTKNHKGTGLGMSIAKEVIEAHDGEISVESQENKGTKIKITL